MASPSAASRPLGTPAAGLSQIGGTVSVIGTWGGNELDSFNAMVKPFEDQTGVDVQFEGTRDVNAVLTTRVQGNNPPDLAILPGPGQMAEFARSGKLVDLGPLLDQDVMRTEYSPQWVTLGSVDGKQVGLFVKSDLKGSVWYNAKQLPQQLAGGQPPRTWDELTALSQKIAATGTTPWCIGLESGAASGWPGTDWIENILLRQAGAQKYDQWWQGQLTWTSPEVKTAWQTWGSIVNDPKMTFGAPAAVLTTNFQQAGNPLFTSPPRCYLHMQGSFITDSFIASNPNLKPVDDFNFFPFPKIDPSVPDAVEVSGDIMGMFRDTPQSRALMRYLATAEAQAIWVKRGGAISANRAVPLDTYPDPISRQTAQTLTSAQTVVFDASDLMPEAMNNAFWQAILQFVQSPNNLDSILQNLDRVQSESKRT